ncbi:MAG TPA: B12-binding domain-containing radical SAM protein, partial [Syntrophorhabdaceae bacterium]|nr:B12-binding domain-containing radical SAM protein [Syntrophorhabdaceae bacterium]
MQSKECSRKDDGRAPFISEKVAKPESLNNVKRHYRRYGMAPDVLRGVLAGLEKPDFILITSIMTYWYEGTREVVRIARESFPKSKTIVGGIYPSLCSELAQITLRDADLIVGAHDLQKVYTFIEHAAELSLPYQPRMQDIDMLPYPCYDLYDTIPFVPLLTSFGCAFKCSYCATPYMYPDIIRRTPSSTLTEIKHWQSKGVNRYVIYDDSFLYDRERYAKPLLKSIQKLHRLPDIYNPNAMNAAFIDQELAEQLIGAGFKEVRIGFETADPEIQRATGGKVTLKNFEKALSALWSAGF